MHFLPTRTRTRFVFIGLCTPSPTSIRLILSPTHHVISRESSPHPSRCSWRVVCAYTTPTTPALTRTGQVWRCRALIRERCTHTCACLEGMIYSPLCPPHDTLIMSSSTVFCHRKSHRRARWLSTCHIIVVFIIISPLLLPYSKATTTVPTCFTCNTTPTFRARMSGNGREWCIAPRMLQDARLSLHL